MARVKSDVLQNEDLINEMAPPRSSDSLVASKNTRQILFGKYAKAGLYVINRRGLIEGSPYGRFLLNPTSWSESKSVNWAAKEVPGQSNQVFQWISSGARTVSFDALITKDFGDSDDIFNPKNEQVSGIKQVKKLVADIAAAFAGAIVNTPINNIKTDTTNMDTIGIQDYLDYYRSLTYPVYSPDKKLQQSPPLLALYVGNSISGSGREPELPPLVDGTTSRKSINFNHEVWILTNLRINITKQLPDLTPMEATVSFQLTQYNTRSVSREKITPRGN